MSLKLTLPVAAKDNPFATHRVEAVSFRFAEGHWKDHLERLQSMNWRAAIVGNQGTGKTTLMLELKARLDGELVTRDGGLQSHYWFVSRDSRKHSKELGQVIQCAAPYGVLLVDGIERLSWRQRRRLLRHNPHQTRLVVTAHGSAGLPVWIHCQTDWPLMQTLLAELVDPPEEALVQEAKRLFNSHRGNIRDVLRSLYDSYSSSAEPTSETRVKGRSLLDYSSKNPILVS